ncbi:MAG TPA: GNAT family N-acetyltransferase, partial [Kofleriaceae bacterium]
MNVRAARPSDYEAWLAFVSYLQVGGTPPSRERFESGICPHAIFVEDEGQLVGYALSFVFGTRGDVRQIAVSPDARHRGVGRRLMAEVRAKLVAGGCRDWRLEVLAENAAAIALYRSVGMAQLAVTSELALSNEVRAGLARPVFPVEPVTDDLEIETAFDLGRGQVQRWRSFRPTARLVHIG